MLFINKNEVFFVLSEDLTNFFYLFVKNLLTKRSGQFGILCL